MSVENSLRRSFSKHANAQFVILKSTLEAYSENKLNSSRKKIWTRLKDVPGYFEFNSQSEAQGAGGERQGYDAVARILFDEIESISDQLDQNCRIYRGSIPQETQITDDIVNSAWTIETFLPANRTGTFSVVVIGLKLPEEGNQVILK
ncbi:hypothetical protein [Leptospira mayottensis]|uniref:Uncharacterized protein n=1 Tax=Leptospira mayottensis 200901122 TaxID=1193010 RepID=A0AA87MM73_9LEPT|nr:hypothetical protein [Leptospira mayottensis]EKR98453.1 hypothetical protein LEP1GSC125_1841 [Leptospira mayottensis 200901122]